FKLLLHKYEHICLWSQKCIILLNYFVFHEISPSYDLFIPIFSILFIVNLVTEHTEYEKMCTAPLRDYRKLSLAVISIYFSVFGCCTGVDSLPSLHSFHAIVLLHLMHVE